MDHDTESSLQSCPSKWDLASFLAWKGTMLKSLQTFGMRNKEFQFRMYMKIDIKETLYELDIYIFFCL